MRIIDLFKKEILHVYYVLLSWKKTIQIALEKVKKIMLFAFFLFFFFGLIMMMRQIHPGEHNYVSVAKSII